MPGNGRIFYHGTDGQWVDGSHDERNEYQPIGPKYLGYWRCKTDGSIWKAYPTTLRFFGFDDAGGFGYPFKPGNYAGQPHAAQKIYDSGWQLLRDMAKVTFRLYRWYELLEGMFGFYRKLRGKNSERRTIDVTEGAA